MYGFVAFYFLLGLITVASFRGGPWSRLGMIVALTAAHLLFLGFWARILIRTRETGELQRGGPIARFVYLAPVAYGLGALAGFCLLPH